MVIMSRNAEVIVVDEQTGREREKYPLVYGAKLFVADGDKVTRGTKLSEWDPFSTPVLTEVSGTVRLEDLEEGLTMQERFDAVTGLSHRTIVESKDVSKKPRVVIVGPDGQPLQISGTQRVASYPLPVGSTVAIRDGDSVVAGDALARVQKESMKTKDITGGLPRVAELFEARVPKDASTLAEIDGIISFGKDIRGKRRVIVTPDNGEAREYLVPRSRYLSVNEGDYVRAGEALTDGPLNPHDLLKIKGEKELARFLVDEIQEVYRLQGVRLNDKHIEVIVRQMLRKVKIKEPGDSHYLPGENVDRRALDDENRKLREAGKSPATAKLLLLGISRASLSTESFISAASFQETTKVLTDAAVSGKVDHLRGLKENLIMGRLIPAGTGLAKRRFQGIAVESAVTEGVIAPEMTTEVSV